MARYVDVIDLPLPPRGAFGLLEDFARTSEWDPGVLRARRLDQGPLGRGSRFAVTVRFWGRELSLDYKILIYEPPHRLVLRARSDSFESRDELHFTPRAGGTRVSYEATLSLSGIARLADPMLQLAFQSIGHAAVEGLREYGRDIAQARAADEARERALGAAATSA
jgi:hypothetical protein